jgi:hypothetical protein
MNGTSSIFKGIMRRLGSPSEIPAFHDVNKKFSRRYYLNPVLIDEENQCYFKQQV